MSPGLFETFDWYTDEALTVSGGATPSKTSTAPKNVSQASYIWVYVENTGANPTTSLTLAITQAPDATSTKQVTLSTFNLSDTVKIGQFLIDRPSGFLRVVSTNGSAALPATFSVTLDIHR